MSVLLLEPRDHVEEHSRRTEVLSERLCPRRPRPSELRCVEAQTVPTASEFESEPGTMVGTSTLVAQGCLAVAGVMLIAYFAIQHRRKKANARPYYTRAVETPKTVRPPSHQRPSRPL